MENSNTLQLTRTQAPTVNYQLASSLIHPLPGKFYVVEYPEAEKVGVIHLPGKVSTSLKSDLAVVIAVGPGVDLVPGDTVAVRPTHGTWIEGFKIEAAGCSCGSHRAKWIGGPGDFMPDVYIPNRPKSTAHQYECLDCGIRFLSTTYEAENRVRVYGLACEFQGEIKRVDWSECAPIKIEGDEMRALGMKVIIRRDATVKEDRGFILSDGDQYRTCLATVVSAGARCVAVKDGDRVHYDPMGLLDVGLCGDDDLAVVNEEDGITAIIGKREEAAA